MGLSALGCDKGCAGPGAAETQEDHQICLQQGGEPMFGGETGVGLGAQKKH